MTNAESDAIIEALKAELKESRYHTDKLQAQLRSVITPLTRDTYSEAVRIYGKHSQLIMSMEEMAELSKELSKNIRGEHNADALAEEMTHSMRKGKSMKWRIQHEAQQKYRPLDWQ